MDAGEKRYILQEGKHPFDRDLAPKKDACHKFVEKSGAPVTNTAFFRFYNARRRATFQRETSAYGRHRNMQPPILLIKKIIASDVEF